MALPRLIFRIFAVLTFLLGTAISLVVSLAVAFETAKAIPRIGILVATTLLLFLVGTSLVAVISAKLWKGFSLRTCLFTSGSLTLLLALGLFFAVLQPSHVPHLVPVARPNTHYWNLPTGSRIAYSRYDPPSGVPVKTDPIVFLHGGPGFRAFDTDHAFYQQFAQDGFTVYLFDQAGSGLSGRLPHGTDYTVERYVADLEAIRQQIGAERLILIGHSWGGELAAHYAAAYPLHVAKLIFHSPGPLVQVPNIPWERQRTDANLNDPIPPPRIFAAFALSYANILATEDLVSQDELSDWQLTNLDPGELVCKGQRSKLPSNFSGATVAGVNMYPLITVDRELKKPELDIRARLANLRVPAITLVSQCEFIPWPGQHEYKKSIPGLQEFYFEDSGHYINFSQPAKLTALIRSFLLDQPPPFPAYKGDADPRPPLRR
jgi:proline iminopeptidase